jgi:dihydroorotate dehydrogenase
LQKKKRLEELLEVVVGCRDWVAGPIKGVRDHPLPLLVKIAPDLDDAARADIASICLRVGVDGIVVSNTTIARPATLRSDPELTTQAGGLSGAPLREMSTKAVSDMYALTKGQLTIFGVGGIASGQDAYDKIRAGASFVQVRRECGARLI